jgi:hypothetical protein
LTYHAALIPPGDYISQAIKIVLLYRTGAYFNGGRFPPGVYFSGPKLIIARPEKLRRTGWVIHFTKLANCRPYKLVFGQYPISIVIYYK